MGSQNSTLDAQTLIPPLVFNRKGVTSSDLVIRDHAFDHDKSGLEYLRAHEIPQLFHDLTARLLSERPLDSLRFLRNILIHAVIQQQDHKARQSKAHKLKHKASKRRHLSSSLHSSPQLPADSFPRLRSSKTSPQSLHLPDQLPITSSHSSSSETSGSDPVDEYDADKVLERRTSVGRARSYSDSMILFNRPSGAALGKNARDFEQRVGPRTVNLNALSPHHHALSDDFNVNLNALSLPISDLAQFGKKSPIPKECASPNNVNRTISSLIDELNVEPAVKSVFINHDHSEYDDHHTDCKASTLSDDRDSDHVQRAQSRTVSLSQNLANGYTARSEQQQNGKLRSESSTMSMERVKSLSGGLANALQHKLKSLSTSARSLPSKLKTIKIDDLSALNALRQIHEERKDDDHGHPVVEVDDHALALDVHGHVDADDDATASTTGPTEEELDGDGEEGDGGNDEDTQSTESDHLNDDDVDIQSTMSAPIGSGPLSMRRSRTVGCSTPSCFVPNFHHIPYRRQRPCFGFDIGGSLAKIAFFEPSRECGWNRFDRAKARFATSSVTYGGTGTRDISLSFPWRNGTFHFMHFQTSRMLEAVDLFKSEQLLQRNESFYATGGGAHKYAKLLTERLSVSVQTGDELKCLIHGLNFLLQNVRDECYYLSDPASKKPSPKRSWDLKNEGSVFPYLLVNCGSGVSILKVDSPTQFERVSGSQVGGGTYWGLCRLCSHAVSMDKMDDTLTPDTLTFAKAFELATKGDATKVNMLVSDIYGGDYPQCNLPGDLVASAFGKCVSMQDMKALTMGDIARGLLDVIAMNVAQLAYMNAMRFKITRVIFAGNFLRQNDLSMAMISYAIHYWSQGVMRALFLKHEGYFGSVGVMLLPDDQLRAQRKSDSESTSSEKKENERDSAEVVLEEELSVIEEDK